MSDDLDRLLHAAVLAPRPEAAKARFLRSTSPAASWPAAAAAALIVGAALASAFARLETPPPLARDAAPALQEPSWIGLAPLGSDGKLGLRARLPHPRARTPFLRLEGSAELPDRCVLMLLVQREEESFDGRRLSPRLAAGDGGYARILRGRFEQEVLWARPGLLRVQATLGDHDQPPEIRDAIRGKHPVREWRFTGPAWSGAASEGLGAELDAVDADAADLLDLIGRFEKACVTEERWLREAPALKPAARALRDRLEKRLTQTRLPASTESLRSAARNLDGDNVHFAWEKDAFQGPVSYHAARQKLKTFRGDAWAFSALRRYAEEATDVADREAALWVVKDLRRGAKPDVDALIKRPGIAPFAERLRAGADLDALEKDLRSVR